MCQEDNQDCLAVKVNATPSHKLSGYGDQYSSKYHTKRSYP